MSDLDDLRKRYGRLKLLTFGLMTAGFVLLWTSQSWADSRSLDRNLRSVILVGSFLLAMTGSGLYARIKGRSAWFAVLGLLSCVGYLILIFMNKSCHRCSRYVGPFVRECPDCRAPV